MPASRVQTQEQNYFGQLLSILRTTELAALKTRCPHAFLSQMLEDEIEERTAIETSPKKPRLKSQHALVKNFNDAATPIAASLQAEVSYTCQKCGRTSFNPCDVANLYCGFCHTFENP